MLSLGTWAPGIERSYAASAPAIVDTPRAADLVENAPGVASPPSIPTTFATRSVKSAPTRRRPPVMDTALAASTAESASPPIVDTSPVTNSVGSTRGTNSVESTPATASPQETADLRSIASSLEAERVARLERVKILVRYSREYLEAAGSLAEVPGYWKTMNQLDMTPKHIVDGYLTGDFGQAPLQIAQAYTAWCEEAMLEKDAQSGTLQDKCGDLAGGLEAVMQPEDVRVQDSAPSPLAARIAADEPKKKNIGRVVTRIYNWRAQVGEGVVDEVNVDAPSYGGSGSGSASGGGVLVDEDEGRRREESEKVKEMADTAAENRKGKEG
ncbi:hypothetical protein MMC24_006247 [Lignoscripta atroalba]|nr:hypothetical protein [Lignoscripta atroalba]